MAALEHSLAELLPETESHAHWLAMWLALSLQPLQHLHSMLHPVKVLLPSSILRLLTVAISLLELLHVQAMTLLHCLALVCMTCGTKPL